jgi:hypothetical protein
MTNKNNQNHSEETTLYKKPHNNKKTKWHSNELTGEFKKIRTPIFDGEMEEGAKSWLPNVGKYFHIYNYSGNLRDIFLVYHLNGKYVIWW